MTAPPATPIEVPDYGSGLIEYHATLLAASGLSVEVVTARGYRSADNKAQLKRFGFSPAQLLVPALVVPMWDVFGGRGGYQARPDDPRHDARTGRVVKYETPGGERIRLDVHPFALPKLRNPAVPLFVTEGVRKGDALVTAGLAAIALTGVWNWRGRNGDDGLTALADWEAVALNGRRVYIVFDSDVVTKSAVHEAMRRLKAFLERRGASVAAVYLPGGPDGVKVGADDFLLDHGPDDLTALAEDTLRRAPDEDDEEERANQLANLLSRVPDEPGFRLLDDLAAFISRYLAFPVDHHADVVALWVLHTHVYTAFDSTPRLAVTSPEKRSGKTRVLEVIEPLVHAPVRTESISAAAVYRLVEERSPTLLIDEVDTIFGPMAGNHEELRALLNSGHRKGAVAYRCVGEGSNQTVGEFRTFAPVALAGIGTLPDTVADRSIHIRMRRRSEGEPVDSFRFKKVAEAAVDLRERAMAWVTRHAEHLVDVEAELPAGVTDRAADVWEPLIILADRAGGRWPHRARDASVTLAAEVAEGQSPAAGVHLLADIAGIFAEPDVGAWLTNVELLRRLKELDESPWDDLHPPLTKFVLARKLRPYGIVSKRFRQGHERVRAYYRDDFQEAWDRYTLPAPPSGADLSGTLGTTAISGGETRPNMVSRVGSVPSPTRANGPAPPSAVPRPDLANIQKQQLDQLHPCNEATVPSVPDENQKGGAVCATPPLPSPSHQRITRPMDRLRTRTTTIPPRRPCPTSRQRRGLQATEPTMTDPRTDPFLMIVPLLAELARAGIVTELDDAGGLVMHGGGAGLDAELRQRIVECAQLLVWEVTGRGSGHAWAACDVCGKASMTRAKRGKSEEWPPCRMTPHCKGRHRPARPPSTRAAAGILPR